MTPLDVVDIDHLYRKVSLCVEIMTNKYLEEKRKGEGKKVLHVHLMKNQEF